jgi:hypothetical protein
MHAADCVDMIRIVGCFILVTACADHGETPPPVDCGGERCGPHQICATTTAGQTCDTNPDAGIGSFDVIDQRCQDVPLTCDAEVTCECLGGACGGLGRPCLDVIDRSASCGCF